MVQHCRREGRRIWATITRRPTLRLSFPRATGAAVTYTLSRFRNNNYLIPEANGEMCTRHSTERKKERNKEGDRFPFGPPRDSFRGGTAMVKAIKSTKTMPALFANEPRTGFRSKPIIHRSFYLDPMYRNRRVHRERLIKKLPGEKLILTCHFPNSAAIIASMSL